ncbi:phospholipid-binding protein, PBP family [Rhizobiales bacterium GAS188]|nr:phospholipid-binding protein, PBP family [Rhizobiales bacterium GAS188]
MFQKLVMTGAAAALSVLIGAAGKMPAKMSLMSDDIKPGATINEEQVFKGFGCAGGNVSPQLSWKGAPADTKSLALTVYDPDAPTGSGFWHWVVFNIPPTTPSLPKNAGDPKANLAPAGSVQSRTDYGTPGYGGPCPPKGDKPHHYIFTIFAVDVDHLDADANASAAVVGFNLHFHTLAKGSFIGRYGL